MSALLVLVACKFLGVPAGVAFICAIIFGDWGQSSKSDDCDERW